MNNQQILEIDDLIKQPVEVLLNMFPNHGATDSLLCRWYLSRNAGGFMVSCSVRDVDGTFKDIYKVGKTASEALANALVSLSSILY